jgi:hypothetical protein
VANVRTYDLESGDDDRWLVAGDFTYKPTGVAYRVGCTHLTNRASMRRSLAVIAALIFSLALATPAHAEPYSGSPYKVCNSSVSIGVIAAIDGYSAVYVPVEVGQCKTVSNYGGRLRIDPDPEWGDPDVDSYVIGEVGYGYRSTWVNSEATFNPPDAWFLNGIRVKTDNVTH